MTSRIENFNSLLNEDIINLPHLKKLCTYGCLDKIRPLVWKILLNFIPCRKSDWNIHLQNCRMHYATYVKEFVSDATKTSSIQDHPLCFDTNSRWSEYFRDNEVLLQINKDCKRLCPDLNFFQSYTDYSFYGMTSEIESQNIRKRIESTVLKSETIQPNRMGFITPSNQKSLICSYHSDKPLKEDKEMHWEVVQRILFIYCKTNKAHSYVQGMNEIIGPLYYVFATDPDENEREHAEADTFYCFIEIMREIQPLFIRSLDSDPHCGIQSRLNQFMDYLKDIDTELVQKLEDVKLLPEFFAFRWVTLYMSREFTLPDVIRFWDTLFSVKNRLEYLIYVCCALIMILKSELMQSNFSQAMFLVQNIQSSNINVDDVIRKSLEYYFRFGDS